MIICVNCGVELEDGLKVCPLCGKDPRSTDEKENASGNHPSDIIQILRKENRRYFWELSGVIAFLGIAVCTLLDFLTGKGLNWSLYSDVSLLSAWVILTLYLYAYKRTLTIVVLQFFTVLAALYLISLITPGRKWFFPVGLPLATAAFLSVGAVIVLYKAASFKGLNIIASALVLLSGFCIVAEIVFDKYWDSVVDLRWSLIVAVSILPVA
ncbi:MAG: DUF6320 domain-containing protein, partial [Bacteroidales bacterium]